MKLEELKNAKVGGGKQDKRPMVSQEDKQQYDEMKEEVEKQHQKDQEFKRQESTVVDTKNNLETITDNFEEMSAKYAKLQDQYFSLT